MFLGRMIARSVLPDQKDRGIVILTTICSEFPDIDFLFANGNPLQSLQTHRGFTHSFLGAALLALLIACVAKQWFLKQWSLRTLYLASLGGLLIHIFFDWVTSYGTMLLYPFSKARFSLDTVFIIDPYIWLILLVPLLLRLRKGPLYDRRNLIATGLLSLYLSLGFLNHSLAMQRLERWVEAQGLQPISLGALPVPLSPLHQRGIVITADRVYDIPLRLSTARVGPSETYPSPFRKDPYIQKAWRTEEGKIFRWFARFPLAEHKQNSPNHRIIFYDLRFKTSKESLGWLGRLLAQFLEEHDPEVLNRKVFVLEVLFNQDGEFQWARLAR